MITEELILSKCHYGTGIYSHIMREHHPDEVVMHISGRDCGVCRNPLNQDCATLHVWTEKINPDLPLSLEIAKHHDEEQAIPDGDCFDFAALYYGLEGQALLDKLAEELHIADPKPDAELSLIEADIPDVSPQNSYQMPPPPKFSFYKHPIQNVKAYKAITPEDAYKYISGHYAQQRTETLRSIEDSKQRSAYKATEFDYVTFSGIFVTRKAGDLVAPSYLIVLDFDHIPDLIDELKDQLPKDPNFETVLIFRSPSGDGLKWVVGLNPDLKKADGTAFTHLEYFKILSHYVKKTYGLEADPSGKDICRACFLPYDPEVVFNPFYCD